MADWLPNTAGGLHALHVESPSVGSGYRSLAQSVYRSVYLSDRYPSRGVLSHVTGCLSGTDVASDSHASRM